MPLVAVVVESAELSVVLSTKLEFAMESTTVVTIRLSKWSFEREFKCRSAKIINKMNDANTRIKMMNKSTFRTVNAFVLPRFCR